MKKRHVFSAPDLPTAEAAMRAARGAGIDDRDISLVACDEVEKNGVADKRKRVGSDFYPAAMRGVLWGGVSGLVVGLIAVSIGKFGFGVSLVVAAVVIGAVVGGWLGMLVGSEVPDPVRRKFEDEIAAGKVLVVIDGDKDALVEAESAIVSAGATLLPFDTPTAMT